MIYKKNRLYIFFILIFIAFSASSIDIWNNNFEWLDQQRMYQLILLCAGSLGFFFTTSQTIPKKIALILLSIFLLGLVSSLAADYPSWALKEWGRYLALTLWVILLGQLARKQWFSLAIIYALAAAGFISAFQSIIYYISAFASEMHILNADILFTGFSNPRFLNQFQVLLMPMLAYLALHHWSEQTKKHSRKVALLLFATLLIHWCIAFSLGGRGLLLGLIVSHLSLLILFSRFKNLVLIQAACALVGFALYYMLFHLIPTYLGLGTTLRESLRAGLSGREQLWLWAWEFAQANPWLGIGPMHYAAHINPIAAHPHQVILQWLAEWGFVATGLALLLGFITILGSLRFLRSTTAKNLDAALWLSIIGALCLAQVDGVFVMPYTETWLATLIGVSFSRWTPSQPEIGLQRRICQVLAIPAILILGNVLINEIPSHYQNLQIHIDRTHDSFMPRFWQFGWIPINPD